MKKITLLTLILFSVISYAQVGINTNTPDASSVLDIESTAGGILIPRLTETQRDAISSPATGLMIYQTDQTTGFYFYNGTAWTRIEGVAGPQGEQGPLGPQGPQGVAGADGVDGADGNGILSTTDNNDGTFTLTYTDGSTFTTSDFTTNISDLEAAISYVAAEALSIGDFVGGGVVFWIDPTDNTKGLACALENQSTGIQWYNGVNTTTNATATAIGSGAANTTAIIDNQGPTETDYAAGLARAFNGGGFSDWFLPSKGELSAMFQNKETLNTTILNNGGQIFQNSAYWSSTEIDNEFARAVGFGNGSSPSYYKYSNAHVRAVRAVNSVGTSSVLTTIAAEQLAQNSEIDLKAPLASPTFTGTISAGQIGIGTATPNTESSMEIATPLPVIFPSMTQGEINAIATPVEGMVQFNEDAHKLQVYAMLTDNTSILNEIFVGTETGSDFLIEQTLVSPIAGQVIAIELYLKDEGGYEPNIDFSDQGSYTVPSYSNWTWHTFELNNPIPVISGGFFNFSITGSGVDFRTFGTNSNYPNGSGCCFNGADDLLFRVHIQPNPGSFGWQNMN